METVGIVSLGIQLCQGLLEYYGSWKDYEKDVAATYESLSALQRTFILLEATIKNPGLSQDIRKQVEENLVSCQDGIKSLQKRLDKVLANKVAVGAHAKAQVFVRRALYPFKESTLAKLREIVRELKENLVLTLEVLQL